MLALFSCPALAGFELKGPQVLPPVVTQEAVPVAPDAPANPSSLMVQQPAPISLTPAGQSTVTSLAAPATPETVDGAGTNVPLRVAAMRIVPIDRMVVFADGVDEAQSVSWSGGKPWGEVLAAMAASNGLALDISLTTVTFGKSEPAAAAAAPKGDETPVWFGDKDEALRAVLQRWCDREHVRLVWEAGNDYPLQAAAHIPGDFEQAARTLLKGFKNAPGKPYGELKRNPAGETVLIVKSRSKNYYGQ